ncbi:MAG: aldo/keto reductase [Nitrosopumilus sp.]|jgi:aryl-alcohol dehydrogenase-like predicted oxidoreductase|uniref:2,5-diketo-D-gluconate reductase A n=1 Tax=Candidatus Nitrosomarinus catalinensis TaxID=1898749 RepID=A0A2Z2HKI1_9ARCH|nr:aldo/keto reductase [Candidatus Nitrosomarinus catalina]ARS64551.1 2,5-diketo-D-gluconate reductase A [Candidatus Nitrosomarinus catalina]MBA4437277.1 aldo/keto reductase [Nitrosopumilaceae archaeon]
MISGYATSEGTKNFSKNSQVNLDNFKIFENLHLSNVGIGTYLGNPDSQTDELVKNAVKQTVLSGVNVIDTAINYRAQKAERSVGKAISELIQEEKITRNQVFVSSKNGYVTNDADIQEDFMQYVMRELGKPGIVKEGDITSGYHCMTTAYLSDQLDRSLKNLDLECIDLMYLHNGIEGQIKDISKDEFLEKLKSVFELYEQKRDEGKIKFYGMATWECFRVQDNDPQHLSLEDIVQMAKKIGGDNHGFKFIQLPYNMNYDQALLGKNQIIGNKPVSILESAVTLGIGVFTSVPFMQGRLLSPGVMPEFSDLKSSLRALQFIRSSPGVLAPLVGQKSAEHVSENLEIMKIPPLSNEDFVALVKKLTS